MPLYHMINEPMYENFPFNFNKDPYEVPRPIAERHDLHHVSDQLSSASNISFTSRTSAVPYGFPAPPTDMEFQEILNNEGKRLMHANNSVNESSGVREISTVAKMSAYKKIGYCLLGVSAVGALCGISGMLGYHFRRSDNDVQGLGNNSISPSLQTWGRPSTGMPMLSSTTLLDYSNSSAFRKTYSVNKRSTTDIYHKAVTIKKMPEVVTPSASIVNNHIDVDVDVDVDLGKTILKNRVDAGVPNQNIIVASQKPVDNAIVDEIRLTIIDVNEKFMNHFNMANLHIRDTFLISLYPSEDDFPYKGKIQKKELKTCEFSKGVFFEKRLEMATYIEYEYLYDTIKYEYCRFLDFIINRINIKQDSNTPSWPGEWWENGIPEYVPGGRIMNGGRKLDKEQLALDIKNPDSCKDAARVHAFINSNDFLKKNIFKRMIDDLRKNDAYDYKLIEDYFIKTFSNDYQLWIKNNTIGNYLILKNNRRN